MKSLILLSIMSMSLEAFAEKKVEFDEAQEKICYEQAKKAGCVKGTSAADQACVKSKKEKFSSSCRQILGID